MIRQLGIVLVLAAAVCGQSAELAIVNADIRTMDPANPTARSLAISGGRLIAVGSSAEVARTITPETKVIDAEGRLVLPGFNDSHVHFTALGHVFSTIDLSGCSSAGEVLAKIRKYTAVLPKGRWILGSGWKAVALPVLRELDAAAPENPVFVFGPGGETALVNSLTTRKAGIDAALNNIAGRDLQKVRQIIPAEHMRDDVAAAEAASNYAASLGITSIHDMDPTDKANMYRLLADSGRLKTRIYDCVDIRARPKEARSTAHISMVRTGCVKAFFEGNETAGEIQEMDRLIFEADREGFQIAVHAIGNRANQAALAAFSKLSAQKHDRRFRIEHAHQALPISLKRMTTAKLIASIQPLLFFAGKRHATGDYRYLLDGGAVLAMGSDASMADMDPLKVVRAAVLGGKLTVQESVAAYTFGSAYAEFQENEKGMLKVGMLGDAVILSDNIFAMPPEKIGDAVVEWTIVNGKPVYQRKSSNEVFAPRPFVP